MSKSKIVILSSLLIFCFISFKIYSDYNISQQQILEQKKKDDLLRWSENERHLKEIEWAEKEKQRKLSEKKEEQEFALKRKNFVSYIQNKIIQDEIFGKKVYVKQISDKTLFIKVEGILGDNEGWLRWHKPNKPYDYYYLDAEKLGFTKVIVLEECTNYVLHNYIYNSEANWYYETEWRNKS
jgi:hypothetical protein